MMYALVELHMTQHCHTDHTRYGRSPLVVSNEIFSVKNLVFKPNIFGDAGSFHSINASFSMTGSFAIFFQNYPVGIF